MKTLKEIVMKFVVLVLALSMAFGVFGMVGCKRDNSDNTLEVHSWTAGYGTDWLVNLLKAFGQEEWVKEKYPKFKYELVLNDNQSFASSRIPLGERNTIDLFFGIYAPGLHGSKYLLDLTDVLFNSEVPGEGVLYKDKVENFVLDAIGTQTSNGIKNYFIPWSPSFGGMIYNKTILEDELGFQTPNTTDELLALMESVKNLGGKNPAYPYKTSIISSKISYADYFFPVWWAQYEGMAGYDDFYNAIDYDGVRDSSNVLLQTGRLKSLEVFHDIYNENNGYYDRTSLNYEFIQGQVRLIRGQGLFMVNGDWFAQEMKSQIEQHKQNGYDYDLRVMKNPVVSAIVEKTPSLVTVASQQGKSNDKILSMVIDEIDQGKTSSDISGISQDDFEFIRQARGVTFSNIVGAATYIPSYASAKELAVDFLRFMATDKGCGIYAANTTGGRTPFKFDIQQDAPEVYEELSKSKTYDIQHDFYEMTKKPYFNPLKQEAARDICYIGSLSPLHGYGDLEKQFMQNKTLTAQKIVDDIYEYYTKQNEYRWKLVIEDWKNGQFTVRT